MDQDYVDKYIKEQLSNHETRIDNDLLWAAIEQKKPSKSNGVFGIFGFVLLSLLLGVTVWMFNQNSSAENSYISNDISSVNQTQNNLKSPIKSELQEPLIITEEQNSKTIYYEIEDTNENESQINISEIKNNEGDNYEENSDENSNTLRDSNNGNRYKRNNSKSNSSLPYSSNSNNKSKSLKNNSKSSSSFTQIDNQESSQLNNNNTLEIKNSIQKGSIQNNKNNSNSINKNTNATKNSNNLFDLSDKNKIEKAISSRWLEDLPVLNVNAFSINNSLFPNRQPTDCPTFGNKKHNIYVQAYTFFDFVSNSFSSTIENPNYLNERQRTQSYLPSYRAGLQAKYVFDNGIYVKGGIEYGQVRELYKDRIVDTIVTIEADQLISYFETSPGDTTFIFGNAPVTTISAKNWHVKNAYKSIDIPILVGYQIKKSKFTYGIEMGVINNIKFSTSAFILDDTGSPRYADEYFNDNIKLSLTGGLSVSYALKNNISLLALGHFKQNMSPINSAVNPIQQKNLNIGLGIGIEYKL